MSFLWRAVLNSLEISLSSMYMDGWMPASASLLFTVVQALTISVADLVFNGSASIAFPSCE